jgi:hypothetical protein
MCVYMCVYKCVYKCVCVSVFVSVCVFVYLNTIATIVTGTFLISTNAAGSSSSSGSVSDIHT